MEEAEARRQKALAELDEKFQASEQTSSAIQARLDAELAGRAETERSLALMRKQRFEEERKNAEAKETLQQQVDALQAELTKRKEAKRASVIPDLQSKEMASREMNGASAELLALREQLAELEKEKDEAIASARGGFGGESELARQNEFLVKELETVMAQRSSPTTPAAVSHTDASVQTETAMLATSTQPEKKSDMTTSKAVKSQEPVRRSLITLPAEPKQVNGTSDRAWKTGSFEDYLQTAQAELSELGSVISANEKEFAKKIEQHVI